VFLTRHVFLALHRHLGERGRWVMNERFGLGHDHVMPRALPLASVLAVSLLLAVGCGGNGSELCQSLEGLQESVRGLQNIELGEDAVGELRQSADEISGDIDAVENAAGDELGGEVADFKASAQALVEDAEAAAAEDQATGESLRSVADSVSAAAASFDALLEAAPDCNL
jgi:hypothetical protein